MIFTLETERLILRELTPEDAERLFLLDSNPEVMKYIGVPPLTHKEESKAIIEHIRKQYQENGVGRWAVIEKESNLLIGWNGLKLNKDNINQHQNFYELGYRFLPETWGKGYATESSKEVLRFGFEELNLGIIYAYAHCENHASNQALKKLGFHKTGEFMEDDGLCYWYELERNEWRIES